MITPQFARSGGVAGILLALCLVAAGCTPSSTESGAGTTTSETTGSTTSSTTTTTVPPSSTTTEAATPSSTSTTEAAPLRVGTPFGTFANRDNIDVTFPKFGANRFLFGSPEEAIQYLDLARETNTGLVFALVQARNMRDENDVIDVDAWKAGVARFADVDFAPYVADGTIIGHYLMDEPKSPGTWGGDVVPNSTIEELAAFSKALWPTVPTIVRSAPRRLIDHSENFRAPAPETPVWSSLDVAWIQYNADLHGPVEDYVDVQVSAAEAQNLDLIVGLQALAGGDGSSGLAPDPPFSASFWIMSYDEMMTYGSYLLEQEIGCAFITFRWQRNDETYFDNNSDVARAHDDLLELATEHEPTRCRAR